MGAKPRGKLADKYSPQNHTTAALWHSKARGSARMVFMEICRRASFDRPESTFTKPQICEVTRLSRPTVQRALDFLRSEGSIVPIRHFDGGRGRAPTYRIEVIGQADSPQDATAGQGMPTAHFSRLVDRHGYSAARSIADRWQSGALRCYLSELD